MVIRKQYDIGQLVEQLQTEVEKSKKCNGVVKLDILTANDILEVIQETHRREQRNKTNTMFCFGEYNECDLDCCMCIYGDECLKEAKQRMSKTNE